ncbi:MAG: DUF58 domain-containing protein, partial [Gammaproteobacteria bacterium]
DWPFDSAFLQSLQGLELRPRLRLAGTGHGGHRGYRHGSSLEFFDYRPYAWGDDPRYVDWNAYARLDRLIVKLFVEEQDLCLHLLIDTSASMAAGYRNKLDLALRAAAALAFIALGNHERVAVGLFNQTLYRALPPQRGRSRFFPLLRRLAEIRANGSTDLHSALTQYALQSKAPGIAVLMSDLLDEDAGYRSGIKSLLKAGFEVHLVHLLAEEELHPRLEGDLRLIDVEGGGEKEATIDRAAIDRYRHNLYAFCDEAREFCLRNSVGYLRSSSSRPLEDLIARQLRQSRLLQ